jgi:hypothetical protein
MGAVGLGWEWLFGHLFCLKTSCQTACPIGFPLIYIHHQKEEVKIPDQSNTPYFPYSTSFLFLIKAFAVLFGKDFI